MARLKIELPASFCFSTRIPIRIGDINRAWHLSHVNMVAILEEARAQYMVKQGFSDEVNNTQRQIGFILGDIAVVFKRQGYYGQILEVEIAAVDFEDKGFDLIYRVRELASGKELARAKTGVLIFDYKTQKVIKITDELKDKLTACPDGGK
ncbi:MAG TPA: thioesterase family protein [Dehalococcoidales bacterium]|nr:thioesterase family protein [Dehalococcoidales bacterium]